MRVQRASANLQTGDCPKCAPPARPNAETCRGRLHLQSRGLQPASRKSPRRARCRKRRSRNKKIATDLNLPGCPSSWLPANSDVGLGLHQPFPFADVLAHEEFIRGRPCDGPVFEGLETPRYAEAAMHVDPFVFDAAQAPLDLLEIGDIVDLAEIRESFLRAHAKRVDVVQCVLTDAAVDVIDLCSVPDRIGLLERDRLEDLNMVAEQR